MFEIVTTIGPSSDSVSTLSRLKSAGATSFRINLSHVNKASLDKYFSTFKSAGVLPSLDTQGAQLRTCCITDIASLCEGDLIKFSAHASTHSQDCCFSLNHLDAFEQLDVGDVLKIDFDGATLQITENFMRNIFCAKVLSGGHLRSNKAVDINNKSIKLNPLTEFDVYLPHWHVATVFLRFLCLFVILPLIFFALRVT